MQEFLPIQSLDIQPQTKLDFDLYVNLPLNNKYVLYRKRGDTLSPDKMESLSTANVKNFYIKKDQYKDFVIYVSKRLEELFSSKSSDQKKMMELAAKSVLGTTFSKQSPAVTQAMMNSLTEVSELLIKATLEHALSYNKVSIDKIMYLGRNGTDFQKHPVNVASLGILVAFGLGYSHPRILSDFVVACLLHDIGLSKMPTSLVLRSHSEKEMTLDEYHLLKRHPEFSIDLIKERGIKISPLTENVILQHHEEYNGSGYPKGIKGYHLNELSQVMRFCDELDVLLSEYIENGRSVFQALEQKFYYYSSSKSIDPDLIIRLRQLFTL